MAEKDLHSLREREKELHCIYRVIQALNQEEQAIADVFRRVVRIIPDGWRYPGICMASIEFEAKNYTTPHFYPTRWYQSADVVVDQNVLGEIRVYYEKEIPGASGPLFLPEEQHLLNMIAEQVSVFIFNRRLRKTVAYLGDETSGLKDEQILPPVSDKHWKWRYQMAGLIAGQMDLNSFGVKAVYLIGSAKNATAGPASDLDLLVHFEGDRRQRELLVSWVDGWSRCMAETNYRMTGYRMDQGMIDLHIVTTRELKSNDSSFATMIGSTENPAKLLRSK